MNEASLSEWLKTTIPGIILLGAAGSIVALWLGKFILPLLLRAMRMPVTFYQGRRRYQAYLLGFSHTAIEEDESGRRLATFLIYHLAKFLFFMLLVLSSWLGFLAAVTFTTYPIFTYAGVVSIVIGLLSLYNAHYEFHFISRYFFGHWGSVLMLADESISKWREHGSSGETEEPVPRTLERSDES
jgi:hypothetical protein